MSGSLGRNHAAAGAGEANLENRKQGRAKELWSTADHHHVISSPGIKVSLRISLLAESNTIGTRRP